jgi:hypothetical protein
MDRAMQLESKDLGAALELYQLQLTSLRKIQQNNNGDVRKKVGELIVFLESHMSRLRKQSLGGDVGKVTIPDDLSSMVDCTQINVSWKDVVGLDEVLRTVRRKERERKGEEEFIIVK